MDHKSLKQPDSSGLQSIPVEQNADNSPQTFVPAYQHGSRDIPYPEVVQQPNYAYSLPNQSLLKEVDRPPPPKRYCGLKPLTFVILVVVLVLVVAGIVGGSIGGVLASRHKDGSGDANPDSAQTTQIPPYRAIAAASCGGQDTRQVFLAYQDRDGALQVNMSPEELSGNWGSWNKIVQSEDVQMNTPLTMACNSAARVEVWVAYLRASDSAITLSSAVCNSDGSNCQWTPNEAIQDSDGSSVLLPEARHLAMNFQTENSMRNNNTLSLYTITNGGVNLISNGTSDRGGWDRLQPTTNDNAATRNSPLASLVDTDGSFTPESHVFWFDPNDVLTTNFVEPRTSLIAPLSDPTNPNVPHADGVPSSLAAHYDTNALAYRLYWVENGQPVEYTEYWNTISSATLVRDAAWAAADAGPGPIASVAGNGTARLFYVAAGSSIVEYYRTEDGGWAEGQLPRTEF